MISLLLVNFRSAALAAEAVRTARATCSRPLQVVVVDNSCDASEADSLRPIADRLVVSESNRGFAGGINAGRRECEADRIVITNPDVRFREGAIDRMYEALDGAAVSGPALEWDEQGEWRLPPGERSTAVEKLDVVVAGRSMEWRRQRDRRRFLRRAAFWALERATEVSTLSGAVMAVRSADFDAVGGFDERFRLYFEETDFLRRMTALRKRIVYVPAARCHHLYNQSAGQLPQEAAERYAESELRYLEKWNGPFLARAIKRLERPLNAAPPARLSGPLEVERSDVVVEASPLPTFETAAGRLSAGGGVDVPRDVWNAFRGDAIYLRTVVRQTGEVLARYARYRT